MIFTKVSLHNYAAFRGRHTIDLTPTSREQPVILIGALNGSGKTSLLDAFSLALYGKRARTASRGDLTYDQFLRECVHRGCEAEGAAVELTFRHRREGQEREVRVLRIWRDTGRTVREFVDVFVDGRPDKSASENWDEEVESLLPFGIAGLFLFDGEKIEQLADLGKAREAIATAIDGLLGLDLVTQLENDLKALPNHLATQSRRAGRPDAADEQWQKVQRLEAELAELTEQAQHAAHLLASANTEVAIARRNFGEADAAFKRAGGDAYMRRAQAERDNELARQQKENAESRLRALAADALPFHLLRPQLSQLLHTGRTEVAVLRQREVVAELERRDAALLATLSAAKSSPDVLGLVSSTLAADRAHREALAATDVQLGLSTRGLSQLEFLLGGHLDALATEQRDLAAAAEAAEVDLQRAQRAIGLAPDESTIAELAATRDAALKEQGATESEALGFELHYAQRAKARDELEAKLASALAVVLATDHEAEDERALLTQAHQVRAQLVEFRHRAVERNTGRIASAVLECFQQLIRKKSLLDTIAIDPLTYDLTLYDDRGRVLPPYRLSAGERQLLATSLLWGLGRVSGRAIPTVIDTPLARLDSKHRRHLVERYFPVASHQVILLSTDEEVHAGWLKVLTPAIGRSYLLDHDEDTRQTFVRDGYFTDLTV